MIFVDFYGPAQVYHSARKSVQETLAQVFRTRVDNVVVRRFPVETERDEVELWVELSSEEQLYRLGHEIARKTVDALRPHWTGDIWTMYRVVPLTNAYLNGQPRGRGTATFE